MRWSNSALTVLVLSALSGCGSDDSNAQSDRVTAACGRIVSVSCAKFVECHATEQGVSFTADLCAQAQSSATSKCVSEEGAGLSAATDPDIDQCVTELSQTQCANLCNQVPADPPTCHKISPSPNTSVVTCAQ